MKKERGRKKREIEHRERKRDREERIIRQTDNFTAASAAREKIFAWRRGKSTR